MGSFEEDKDIIKQNLECVTERPDAVFGIRMLMEDKCEMPDRETVQDVMDRHLALKPVLRRVFPYYSE